MSTLETLVVALLVAGIVAALVEGLRRRSGAVVVNTVAVLGITALPLDLVFDIVGALLVIALDVRLSFSIIERHPEIAGALLTGSAVACAIGIVALTVVVVVLRRLD